MQKKRNNQDGTNAREINVGKQERKKVHPLDEEENKETDEDGSSLGLTEGPGGDAERDGRW